MIFETDSESYKPRIHAGEPPYCDDATILHPHASSKVYDLSVPHPPTVKRGK